MNLSVAHVNVSRGYRGGERQTELLLRELARHDVQQVLVARKDETLASRVRDLDIDIRPISGSPLAVARATHGVDIVHVHEGRSVYGAWLRSLISGTPYVLTRRVNNPIKNNWLAHRVYRRAAFVVSVAPQIAEVVMTFDGRIRSKVIHSGSSGLPVDAAQSAAIRRSSGADFLVGNVGALDNAQKGQEYIIEVARDLQASHPDVHFMLVGGGDDEAMLRDAAAGLTNLSFAGFVDNVGDYLAAFDVFILPSNKEGIAGILLDAMERELPIVAADVGGVTEIAHDGENAIIIEPAQPEQLKAAILKLHADPALRQRLGENGKAFAKGFTAGVMCDRYLALYRQAPGAS